MVLSNGIVVQYVFHVAPHVDVDIFLVLKTLRTKGILLAVCIARVSSVTRQFSRVHCASSIRRGQMAHVSFRGELISFQQDVFPKIHLLSL